MRELAFSSTAAETERAIVGRRGVVRLAGRTFLDDNGPFLGVGTSLFWAAWGYEHDRARLEENLKCAAGRLPPACTKPVDYIRVFGIVGPSGWRDRTSEGSTATIAGLTDLAYDTYGLRVEWTIFGTLDQVPTPDARDAAVARFATVMAPRAHKVMHWEVANEATLTGFGDGESGRQELFRLAGLLRTQTPNLVALTSPQGRDADSYYDGSPANLLTIHLDRSTNGTGGVFRPIRQARQAVDQPRAWSSNEPIGPQSSVRADDDPTRMVLGAVYTWLCKGAGYVYHTGAGVRGGGVEDAEYQRNANLWEIPHWRETVEGFAAVRKILPADLPNWSWFNGNSSFPGYPFDTGPIANEDNLLRAYTAIAPDGRFVTVPIDVKRPTPFAARRPMAFDIYAVPSGARLAHVELAKGAVFTIQPTAGVILVGQLR